MICPKCKEKLLWCGEHDSHYDDDAKKEITNLIKRLKDVHESLEDEI